MSVSKVTRDIGTEAPQSYAALSPREVLAARLARALLRAPRASAFVLALCGPPVSGKTRLAGRVVELLLQPDAAGADTTAAQDTTALDDTATGRPTAFYAQTPGHTPAVLSTTHAPPLIVHFNPAFHATRRQLLEQFFRKLSMVLKQDRATAWHHIGTLFDAYAALLSPLSLLLPTLGRLPLLQRLLRDSAHALDKFAALADEDLHVLRPRLEAALRAEHRRVIIVMDDLDRLDRAEIRQLFQLLTRSGNLPNLTYLLVFDPQPVRRSLIRAAAEEDKDPLQAYVHYAVQVPPLDAHELTEALRETLRHVYDYSMPEPLRGGVADEVDDAGRERRLFAVIRSLFIDLHDVTNFGDTLCFAAGMLCRDEVRQIDFIAVTALRVFEPALHAAVREHKALFVSAADPQPLAPLSMERLDRVLGLASRLDRQRTATLLATLFPRVSSLLPHWPHGERPCCPRQVCDPRAFDACFSSTPPPLSSPG